MNKLNLKSFQEEIFNFPCDYPIKVMGKDSQALHVVIRTIIERHTGEIHSTQITSKKSTKGNYISYTIRIVATSVSQLDSINKELQDHPLVAYIL